MEDYNNMIAKEIDETNQAYIRSVPQPTMFGGRRLREYVLPGMPSYAYPDHLAVGGYDSSSDEEDQRFRQREVVGAGFKDFTRGIKKGFNKVVDVTKRITSPLVKKLKGDAESMGNELVKASQDELMKQYDSKKQDVINSIISKGAGVKPKRITMKKLKEGGALYKANDMNVRTKQRPMLASYQPYSVQEKEGGAFNLKKFGLDQYNKIPDAYKPGIESLGRQAIKDLGFGGAKSGGAKSGGAKLIKGSPEMKAKMAKLRAMRKK